MGPSGMASACELAFNQMRRIQPAWSTTFVQAGRHLCRSWTGTLIFLAGVVGAFGASATELSQSDPADWPRYVPESRCTTEACVPGTITYTIQSGRASGRFFDDGNEACTIATNVPGSTWGLNPPFGQGCFWPPYTDANGQSQPAGYASNLVLKDRGGSCHGLDPQTLIGFATPPIEDQPRCIVCGPGKAKPSASSEFCVYPIEQTHDKPGSCPVGNPFFPLTGIKRQSETLGPWFGGADVALQFDTRRKLPGPRGMPFPLTPPPSFGELWGSTLHKRLVIQSNDGVIGAVQVPRAGGEWISFRRMSATTYTPDPDVADRLAVVNEGWRFFDAASRAEESYDGQGKLLKVSYADGRSFTYAYSDTATPADVAPAADLLVSVADQHGRTVRFEYEQPNGTAIPRVARVVDPQQQAIRAAYDAAGNLTDLTWPDNHTRTFLYEQTGLPWALTGILDENRERFSTYAYDADGLALSTEHAGGTNRYSVSYGSAPRWMVTETYDAPARMLWRDRTWGLPQGTRLTLPNGSTADIEASLVNGTPRISSRSQPAGAGCDASSSSLTYDSNGNIASKIDFNGTKSCHAYDQARNVETTQVEGLPGNTACSSVIPARSTLPDGSRKVVTDWHPDWRLETRRAEPRKVTTFVYNGQPDPTAGNTPATCAPADAQLPDGKPIAVLCKKVEQATTDLDGAQGTSVSTPSDGVVLLLHMDGTNGGTGFIDSGPLFRTVVRSGAPVTSTAQSRFGGASGQFLGSSSDSLFLAGSAATQLPGDFTIEAFVFWQTLPPAHAGIFASGHELFRSGSTGTLSWWDGSATRITGVTTITAGVWHHVALARQGSTVTAYLDGRPEGSYSSTATLGLVGNTAETVGSWRGTSEFMNGFIDELRVTKGSALYTEAFTPPQAPLSGWRAGGPALDSGVPAQTWAYAYNPYGQMLTARDPRNKLTTYAYYSDTTADHTLGDLQSVTDSTGRVTQYTRYDKSGRLLQSIDTDGTVTDTTYTPRGWVKSVTVSPPEEPVRVTTYDYDGVGQLKKATLPKNVVLEYSYDAAHRLTSVKDNAGNSVTYTLDNMGNRKAEDLKDPDGTLARNITRVFDALNRAQSAAGALQ